MTLYLDTSALVLFEGIIGWRHTSSVTRTRIRAARALPELATVRDRAAC